MPMDKTLACALWTLAGRRILFYDASFAGQSCGGMDVQMAREFFYAVSYSAMMNLHLKVLYGEKRPPQAGSHVQSIRQSPFRRRPP